MSSPDPEIKHNEAQAALAAAEAQKIETNKPLEESLIEAPEQSPAYQVVEEQRALQKGDTQLSVDGAVITKTTQDEGNAVRDAGGLNPNNPTSPAHTPTMDKPELTSVPTPEIRQKIDTNSSELSERQIPIKDPDVSSKQQDTPAVEQLREITQSKQHQVETSAREKPVENVFTATVISDKTESKISSVAPIAEKPTESAFVMKATKEKSADTVQSSAGPGASSGGDSGSNANKDAEYKFQGSSGKSSHHTSESPASSPKDPSNITPPATMSRNNSPSVSSAEGSKQSTTPPTPEPRTVSSSQNEAPASREPNKSSAIPAQQSARPEPSSPVQPTPVTPTVRTSSRPESAKVSVSADRPALKTEAPIRAEQPASTKSESPSPKEIIKVDPQKSTAETIRAERQVNTAVQQSKSTDAAVTKNFSDIVKTLAKDEIVKVVTDAIKKALTEGSVADLAKIIKSAITEPVVREGIRTVIQASSGGDGSTKGGALSNLKATDSQHVRLDLSKAAAVEAIQLSKPLTREQAMSALMGILVDASKLNSAVVQQIRSETAVKISTIEGAVPELVKAKFEQLIALNGKLQNVDPAVTAALLHNAVQELATALGLTPEQRALISIFNIQLSTIDYGTDQDASSARRPAAKADGDDLEKQKLKERDLKDTTPRLLTPEELEKMMREQLYEIEEFLKERDEVKLKRAKEELEKLLKETVDEEVEYMIDQDFEVVKTYSITGIVRRKSDGKPLPYTKIYAGILGTFETDLNGEFVILNVPNETTYMIGADKIGYVFDPEFAAGTLTGAVNLKFIAEEVH